MTPLKAGNVLRGYIDIIEGMYERAEKSVRITCGKTGEFPMTIGFVLGVSFKPLSFCTNYEQVNCSRSWGVTLVYIICR